MASVTRVLVLHDSKIMCDQFQKFGSRQGYSVTIAEGPEHAQRLVSSFKPHVAIVDWQLSGVPSIDFNSVRWPNAAMRKYVLEGRTPMGALRFMESRGGELKALATQAQVSTTNGVIEAGKLLAKSENLKILMTTNAAIDLPDAPGYKKLKETYGDRIAIWNEHEHVFLEALPRLLAKRKTE